MNYQKVFDTISWTIVIVCIIAGFIIPLYLYDIAPSSKEVNVQLLRRGEIPPSAIRVFDVKDIETVGEVKQVFGTYDFYSCNRTYVSILFDRRKDLFDRRKNIIEFSVRGIASNGTFDYRFQKDVPYTNTDNIITTTTYYHDAGNILSFSNEGVVIEYYKTFGNSFLSAILGAMTLGLVSFIIMIILETILKSSPVQGMYRGAKRFTSRGKKE